MPGSGHKRGWLGLPVVCAPGARPTRLQTGWWTGAHGTGQGRSRPCTAGLLCPHVRHSEPGFPPYLLASLSKSRMAPEFSALLLKLTAFNSKKKKVFISQKGKQVYQAKEHVSLCCKSHLQWLMGSSARPMSSSHLGPPLPLTAPPSPGRSDSCRAWTWDRCEHIASS